MRIILYENATKWLDGWLDESGWCAQPPQISTLSERAYDFEPRSRLVLTIDKPSGAVGVMGSPMRGLSEKASEVKADRLQSAATLHHSNPWNSKGFSFS